MGIFFYSEKIDFSIRNKNILKAWIKNTIKEKKNLRPSQINIIFTSDNYLLELNKKYLLKNYFTDTITFNYSQGLKVSGDIFISIDSVRKNARKFKTFFNEELYRVIIHGVLHLLGFDDKDDNDNEVMKYNEDYYLDLLKKEIVF